MKDKLLNSGFGIGNIVFIAAIIVALPLRIYQYVAGILEPGTGFYLTNDWSIYVLYAVIICTIIASVTIGLTKKKSLDFSYKAEKSPLLGAFAALSAAGLIIDVISNLPALNSANGFIANSSSSGLPSYYILLAQVAFAFISAMFFVILAITSFAGKTSGADYRILSLAPVFWSILRMVSRFMRTISYVRVSELLFEMVMLMFMIMFFMAFAQCNAKVNEAECKWKVAAYGIPAAFMALLCSAPRIILLITGSADLIYSQSSVEFADFGIALFIIAVVLTKVITKSEETEVKEIAEETQKVSEETTVSIEE